MSALPISLMLQVNGRIMYADERPEWQMEKYRFYVELPGDIWEDGYFMQLIKMNQVSPHCRPVFITELLPRHRRRLRGLNRKTCHATLFTLAEPA